MSFRITWLHKPHIIRIQYEGTVTGLDLTQSMQKVLRAVMQTETYLMLDFSAIHIVPNDLFSNSLTSQLLNHANTQWCVVIASQDRNDRNTRLLTQDKIKLFSQYDSAYAFLIGMLRLDKGIIINQTPS
ncbi:hypothetical protein MASR2M15_22780 [Anaerolineales bacterium]